MPRSAPPAAGMAAINFRPGGILAGDLARETGLCYGHDESERPHFFKLELSDSTADARNCAFQERFGDLLELIQPRQLVLEAPLHHAAATSIHAISQQLTLRSLARMEACYAHIPVFEVDVATVRNDVLGRRYFAKNETKRMVVRYCHRRGWRVKDHNEADAAVLWLWYVRQIKGQNPVAGPLWAELAA